MYSIPLALMLFNFLKLSLLEHRLVNFFNYLGNSRVLQVMCLRYSLVLLLLKTFGNLKANTKQLECAHRPVCTIIMFLLEIGLALLQTTGLGLHLIFTPYSPSIFDQVGLMGQIALDYYLNPLVATGQCYLFTILADDKKVILVWNRFEASSKICKTISALL